MRITQKIDDEEKRLNRNPEGRNRPSQGKGKQSDRSLSVAPQSPGADGKIEQNVAVLNYLPERQEKEQNECGWQIKQQQ